MNRQHTIMRRPILDWLRTNRVSGPICGTKQGRTGVQSFHGQSNLDCGLADGLLAEVLFNQVGVDRKSRFGPLGSRDDDPLHGS